MIGEDLSLNLKIISQHRKSAEFSPTKEENRHFSHWSYFPPFLIKPEAILQTGFYFFGTRGSWMENFWMENTIVQFWDPGSGTRVPRFFD